MEYEQINKKICDVDQVKNYTMICNKQCIIFRDTFFFNAMVALGRHLFSMELSYFEREIFIIFLDNVGKFSSGTEF